MSLPYGQNEGDIWTGEGSQVQDLLDQENPGLILIHEMHTRGDVTEEVVFTTDAADLIAKARSGDRIFGTVLCPRCERERYLPYGGERPVAEGFAPPALSRVDNATYICTPCGSDEAMRDYTRQPPVPPDEWPLNPREAGEFGIGGKLA
jgi:hypothetical protein